MTRDREYIREYVIEIALGRLLPFLLLIVAVVLAFSSSARAGPEEAPALAPATWVMGLPGSYYLTSTSFQADDPLTACAAGYHMASLWEVMDLSNLSYNTSLGFATSDSGKGPPANIPGWVRTGANSYTGDSAGRSNCAAWTSNTGTTEFGTTTFLPSSWSLGADLGVWEVATADCDSYRRVWCVRPPSRVYLPLVLRSY